MNEKTRTMNEKEVKGGMDVQNKGKKRQGK
jgi:hypothetical protein